MSQYWGGCKLKEMFCTKCACCTSKLHHFWDKNNKRPVCSICEEVWGDGGGDTPDRCWQYPVDDKEEILHRSVLSDMLSGQKLHLEESLTVKVGTHILYDPSLEGKQ